MAKTKMTVEDVDTFGVALHTALRKACDSAPTTGAYIQIDAMPNDLWGEFLDVIWPILQADEPYTDVAKQCKWAITEEYDPSRLNYEEVCKNDKMEAKYNKKQLQDRYVQRSLLRLWFRCFDDGDWQGFTVYLTE